MQSEWYVGCEGKEEYVAVDEKDGHSKKKWCRGRAKKDDIPTRHCVYQPTLNAKKRVA